MSRGMFFLGCLGLCVGFWVGVFLIFYSLTLL